jgi:hypothetical protein
VSVTDLEECDLAVEDLHLELHPSAAAHVRVPRRRPGPRRLHQYRRLLPHPVESLGLSLATGAHSGALGGSQALPLVVVGGGGSGDVGGGGVRNRCEGGGAREQSACGFDARRRMRRRRRGQRNSRRKWK